MHLTHSGVVECTNLACSDLEADGTEPFTKWFSRLRDPRAQARSAQRLLRLAAGNPGDYKPANEGVSELREDYGPGYRVYFALAGPRLVLLLCGGTKQTQAADIKLAKQYWKDFKQRSKPCVEPPNPGMNFCANSWRLQMSSRLSI